MNIKDIDKKIRQLEMQRAELEFKKEFKHLKRPRRDTMGIAEIRYGMQVDPVIADAYEKLFEKELYECFAEVKRTCWKYWLKKNPIKKKNYDI